MNRITQAIRWLLSAGMLIPGLLQAFVVYNYDARTDWIRFDFVGWVRVEQVVEQAKLVKGNAALQLRVIEQVAGADSAPVITLEYEAALPDKDGQVLTLADSFYWNLQAPPGSEFLVFLSKLENGTYWCDNGDLHDVKDGKVRLPSEYEKTLGLGLRPSMRDLIAKVRASVPGIRARVGHPLFDPPLTVGPQQVETPKDSFERIISVVRENRLKEADGMLYPTDKDSSPKYFRGLDAEFREEFVQAKVIWQAVIDDQASVVVAFELPKSQDRFYRIYSMLRQGKHWLLLNPAADAEEAQKLAKVWKDDYRMTFETLLERDHLWPNLTGRRIRRE